MACCGCFHSRSKRLRAQEPPRAELSLPPETGAQTLQRNNEGMISLHANRGQGRMQSNPIARKVSNLNFRSASADLTTEEKNEVDSKLDRFESRPLILKKGSVISLGTRGKRDSSGLWSLPTSPAKSMSSSTCDNDESNPTSPVTPVVSWSHFVETAMSRSVAEPTAQFGQKNRAASSLDFMRTNLPNHDRSRSVSVRAALMARKSARDLFSNPDPDQFALSPPNIVRVELQAKDSSGFGLIFRGCKSKADGEQHGFGVFISDIKPHSLAYNSGIIPGLQVCSINGMDFTNCSFVELRAVLENVAKTKKKVLQLELQENHKLVHTRTMLNRAQRFRTPWDYTSPSCTIRIVLKKALVGFGIFFGGAKNKTDGDQFGFGVFVERVRTDSPAAKESMIFPGIQIVEMNGVNLRDATLLDLRKVVRATTKTMTLTLQKPETERVHI
eukprot:m.57233 g.57233  ORF g.57233 m.57233 type:complete len:443 (-) comp22351_c0_seq1:288-1616(-)